MLVDLLVLADSLDPDDSVRSISWLAELSIGNSKVLVVVESVADVELEPSLACSESSEISYVRLMVLDCVGVAISSS